MSLNKLKTQYTLSDLIAGLDVTIEGDPTAVITSVATLQDAKPGSIAFLMNPLYKKYLATTQATAVILCKDEANECPVNAIVSRDPYYTYALIARYFENKPRAVAGIHPTAVIGKNCSIDPTASIGPNCVLQDGVKICAGVVIEAGCVLGELVEVGENSHLDANVSLYHRIILGKRVRVSSGTVIGSDGFGIAKHAGVWHKVPQMGRVIIENDVEIGANCAIDRGAIGDTVIEEGVKLDNQIQIGHNVRIGRHTAIAGCVGIAGSATIGSNCLIGGSAGVNGHINIADNVVVTGMTAVTKSITKPGIYSSGVGGLVSNLEWRKNSARLHRLDLLNQRVKALESALKELTEREDT